MDAALGSNDRLLYVGDTEYGERALAAFGAAGDRALADGRFIVENSANTYMRDGHFSGSRMVAHYRKAVYDAVSDGFDGLRVAAEMSWAVQGLDGKERLVEYERTLDRALEGKAAIVLCQYDRRLYHSDDVAAIETAHVHSARPNPLFASRTLYLERTYAPHGLLARGELDVTTREAFRDALLQIASSPGEDRLVVDLRRVAYLDAGAVGALVGAALAAQQVTIALRVSPAIGKTFEILASTLPRSIEIEEAL